MRGYKPRALLFRAFLLDFFGQLIILVALTFWSGLPAMNIMGASFRGQDPWLFFCLLIYPLLGWLFGSYTVLRWRHLEISVLLQRLSLTAVGVLTAVTLATWLLKPDPSVWLVNRWVQFSWLGLLTIWSLLVRLGLRRGLFSPRSPRLLLLADNLNTELILKAWSRVPSRYQLEVISSSAFENLLKESRQPLLLAISPACLCDPKLSTFKQSLQMQDPRFVQTISIITLFESLQERLPSALLTESGLSYEDLPWSAPLSVQAQLKRLADIFLSSILLLLTAPFVVIAAFLIWLEDRGPIFYSQCRTGWLGRPYILYKLRTMVVQNTDGPVRWTQPVTIA